MLVVDSGGLSRLARRDRVAAQVLLDLRRRKLWPPMVPSVVLVESLTGSAGRDAPANHLLKSCVVATSVSEQMARRAASLRTSACRGSAVDALMVAFAEHSGTVLTSDSVDLRALAANAVDVRVEVV